MSKIVMLVRWWIMGNLYMDQHKATIEIMKGCVWQPPSSYYNMAWNKWMLQYIGVTIKHH